MVVLDYEHGYKSIKAIIQPVIFSHGTKESILNRFRDALNEAKKAYSSEIFKEPLIATNEYEASWIPDKIGRDVDFVLIFVNGVRYWYRKLTELGIPLVTWENRGYSHAGSWDIRGFLSKWGANVITPIGIEEHRKVARVISAIRALRRSKMLVFGKIPTPNVASEWNLENIERKIGVTVKVISIDDLLSCMDTIEDKLVDNTLEKWKNLFVNYDPRKLREVVRIYLAFKEFLKREKANALTINCLADLFKKRFLPPCIALSRLIDEGIIAGCEADINVALSMMILSYLTRKPSLMGNIYLFRPWPGPGFPPTELIVEDIKKSLSENVIRLTHDIIPLTMSESNKWVLEDYHGTGKGATAYAPLKTNEKVTLLRISPDLSRMTAIIGTVIRVDNTIHCRLSVWIKVSNARKIADQAFSLHHAMVYGDISKELELFSKLTNIKLTLL